MLSVGGRVLPVVTAVLGVVGEVVQVVTMAGVAWPYPEGRPDAENLQNLFFFDRAWRRWPLLTPIL